MKKIIKYLRNILIVVAVLLAITAGVTQTQFFKDFLRDKITEELNKGINGKIVIGQIKGNLFTDIDITNIQLMDRSSMVISIKKINLDYNVFSLLSNEISVNSLLIDSVVFNLIQQKDSSWNISNIFIPSEDTTSSPFDWKISLTELKMLNCSLNLSPLDTTTVIPKSVSKFNINAGGFYTNNTSSLQLKSLSFAAEPELIIKDIRLNADLNDNDLQISKLYLETGSNKISGEGRIDLATLNDIDIKIKTDPLNTKEFYHFSNFKLDNFSPSVSINLTRKKEDVYLESILSDSNRSIEVVLTAKDSIVKEGTIVLKNLNLADLLNDRSLDGTINGDFAFAGYWKNESDNDIQLNGNLVNTSIFKRRISKSGISAKLKRGNLTSDIVLSGTFGTINLEAAIQRLFLSPSFNFQTTLNNINLSPLLLNDSLYSDLNLTITGDGRKFDINSFNNLQIFSNKQSRIKGYNVDSLYLRVNKKNDYYSVDSLFVMNNDNSVTIKGQYLNESDFNADLLVNLSNFAPLKPYINADTLGGRIEIIGNVSGSFDSLSMNGNIGINDFQYDQISVNSLNGSINAGLLNSKINGNFNLLLNEILYDSLSLSQIRTAGTYQGNQLNSEVNLIFSDSLESYIKSSITFDSVVTITVPDLAIKGRKELFQNKKGTITISLKEDELLIDNFNLHADTGYISVNAKLKSKKELNADINIHSIKLKKHISSFIPGADISGIADIDIEASGGIENPHAVGTLNISGLIIDQYNAGDISASIVLENKILNLNLLAHQEGGRDLQFKGYVPLNIAPGDTSVMIDREKKFEANLILKDYNISNAKFFSKYFNNVQGMLNCSIYLQNTLQNPQLQGTFHLSDGSVQNEKLGINYKDIDIKLQADSSKIRIDTAFIQSNKGRINLSGYFGSKSNLLSGKHDDVNVNLSSSNFEVINGEGINVFLDGNLHLFSENEKLLFDGKFNIPNSKAYLPSLIQTAPKEKDSDSPLLAQAISPQSKSKLQEDKKIELSSNSSGISGNVNGKINVTIPDNTWISGKNANVEIKGNLIAEKTDDAILLTGRIKTGKGYLYIYGKKFVVTKGEIIFNGEKDINPLLDLTIDYDFKSPSGDNETITVLVTGTANDPRITFLHDDEQVTEGDAISYIVFGTKMENLTQSQQSEIGGNQYIISDAVTGMLTSRLSSKIGRTIGLDVFEIAEEDNWQKASLTAGKYATEDLYISYEHSFPIGNSNETEESKINIEYEILNFLFLQLIGGNTKESGMNIIIKFD